MIRTITNNIKNIFSFGFNKIRKEEDGVGVVEVILILLVLVGLSERQARGKNDRVYDRLSEVFNFEQAMGAKGNGCSRNAVKQMLKNWHNQGLIEYLNGGRYQKIATTK